MTYLFGKRFLKKTSLMAASCQDFIATHAPFKKAETFMYFSGNAKHIFRKNWANNYKNSSGQNAAL